VSALPCGECALVPLSSSAEGTLGRKWLGREEQASPEPTPLRDRNRTGAKPSSGMPEDPKAKGMDFHCSGILRYKSGRSDTKPECRSVCYSCSEKICRWNHTGWQGALLARLIVQPLAMTSIVIGGSLFEEAFVRQALFERAGTPCLGVMCPEFRQTTIPFHSSREVLEGAEGEQLRVKLSTAGLSVVWSSPCGLEGGPAARSISRSVEGFYDVLIGHTGERQGLKGDRQVARKPGSAAGVRTGPGACAAGTGSPHLSPAPPTHSWVSPLSKQLLAHDALASLSQALGSQAALERWLAEGLEEVATAEAGQSAGVGAGPPARKRQRTAGLGEAAEPATYSRLKDAMAGSALRERRRRFHGAEPFVHWRRKCLLSFEQGAATGAPVLTAEVDGFAVKLPESARPAAKLCAGALGPAPEPGGALD